MLLHNRIPQKTIQFYKSLVRNYEIRIIDVRFDKCARLGVFCIVRV